MKIYSISTKSESGDDYLYHVQCEQEPTDEQLHSFLMEFGNDKDDEETYESVIIVKELNDVITIE